MGNRAAACTDIDGVALPLTVEILRAMLRNLLAFRALYETEGKDILTGPDGTEWSLWDLEHLYEAAIRDLPRRQSQAIQLFLVYNMREADVAEAMGLSRTNPIGMYATSGIERVLEWVQEGRMARFRDEESGGAGGTHEVRGA